MNIILIYVEAAGKAKHLLLLGYKPEPRSLFYHDLTIDLTINVVECPSKLQTPPTNFILYHHSSSTLPFVESDISHLSCTSVKIVVNVDHITVVVSISTFNQQRQQFFPILLAFNRTSIPYFYLMITSAEMRMTVTIVRRRRR